MKREFPLFCNAEITSYTLTPACSQYSTADDSGAF